MSESLTVIDISRNEISALPTLPKNLIHLNIAINRIEELPEKIFDCTKLKLLDFSDNKISHWPTLPLSLERLFASNNKFTTFPELGNDLEAIDLSNNKLTHLSTLPAKLRNLNISNNVIEDLPVLPDGLISLNVADNNLQEIPEKLPTTLTSLDISLNEIIEIRCALPSTLKSFKAAHNGLIEKPDLPVNCSETNFDGNPFMQLMPELVSKWLGKLSDEEFQKWSKIRDEPGAKEFSFFLDRLRLTVNFQKKQFQSSVVQWLHQLSTNPNLRKDTFLIAIGATESCENRLSLNYNKMRKINFEVDVAEGRYDDNVNKLIDVGRNIFRLNELEKIAEQKINNLMAHNAALNPNQTDTIDGPDEIEVHLEYQVKLREKLQLFIATEDKLYFGHFLTYLTEKDVSSAETLVKTKENNVFSEFFTSQWQPWQRTLQRLCQDKHALIKNTIELEIDQINAAIQDEMHMLLNEKPRDYLNTIASLSKTFDIHKKEISYKYHRELTKDFLGMNGIDVSVLDSFWATAPSMGNPKKNLIS